ncbi:MAG: hypothetical protein IJ660_01010 [Alphaproteobacteria bacterium]|nr:hypothetical protein [Alphaproteobacteria bacterium]
MSNLEELSYAIISELRDQLEAKEQMIKNLTELLNEIDGVYSVGINKSETEQDEYVLYQETFTKLDELFRKWEAIRK